MLINIEKSEELDKECSKEWLVNTDPVSGRTAVCTCAFIFLSLNSFDMDKVDVKDNPEDVYFHLKKKKLKPFPCANVALRGPWVIAHNNRKSTNLKK